MSRLFVVVDVGKEWENRNFESLISQTLLFCHCHLSLQVGNQVVFVAAGESAKIISNRTNSNKPPNKYKQFYDLDTSVVEELKGIKTGLSVDKAIALYQNKHKIPKNEILVMSIGQDHGYRDLMNTMFACQKAMIPIHCCRFSDSDSNFLKQAAYITRGIYKKCSVEQLVHVLIFTFLPSETRDLMILPPTADVSFTSTCFCHKKPVDLGHVCHVCLSIFCEKLEKCTTCQSEFE